ncbi:AP-1-like transcription factor [Elsinoe australis]|uniref:AP-1-like transcription factor n=1 Tax=Elsinoe australis TaxID=40998 RepID=A0A2P7ZQD8_9PEZI|nr:AP-1-like transcription factor [Elsinoe australis]
MDSFAQTGAQQDDLFNDFTNGEESMQTRAPDDLFGDDFTPVTEADAVEPVPPPAPDIPASRGRGGTPRGRGRGTGRGGFSVPASSQTPASAGTSSKPAFNPLGESRHAPNPLGESRHAPPPVQDSADTPPVREQNQAQSQSQPEDQTQPTPSAPTEPRQTKAPAVRGDRSATGGSARTKLTEEELAAKISSIKLRNASLEAAHARAQADADSFAQRENEAAKKRQEERRDRQQMMGEREKNRMRKLKAQEGREWDSEKREEDFSDRRRGYGRGAHGGITGTRLSDGPKGNGPPGPEDDGREYIYRENRGSGRGRGGRGGRVDGRASQHNKQSAPLFEDFPALSANNGDTWKAPGETGATPKLSFPSKNQVSQGGQSTEAQNNDKLDPPPSSGDKPKQSWADMVEESRA